jgi:hypothetical protein
MAETGMSRSQESPTVVLARSAKATFRFLASLKLAVLLLLILAAVLAWATILETNYSAAHARWYVYESGWFIGLLALLGVNIFCAAASRFPWKRHHTGFVVTHCGLLVLLAGAVWSFVGGVEGRVSLTEGQTTHDLVLSQRSQITAFWVGRPQEPPFEFTFDGGPADWPAGKTLNIGEVDGVKSRILGYLQSPRAIESWVPDEAGLGGPALKFKVVGQDNARITDGWLVDQHFGDAVALGPVRIQLERAVNDRMAEDFLEPRIKELGDKGLLVMYLGNAVERVLLDEQIGQKIALGNTGVSVEIIEYLPHASPDALGKFTSKSDQPKNPMVELRVHLPDEQQPLRQIAFAKDPLLNLDGVYSRVCPVKFRFYHPAIQPQTAVELMQNTQGKLLARSYAGGAYTSQGEVRAGERIAMPGNFQLEIVEHIPHARRKVTFAADSSGKRRKKEKSEPAALVEIRVGGVAEQVWLRRNDPAYGQSTLTTPSGTLALNFEQGREPLGFSLKLVDFKREKNPGAAGNAAFSSKVRVIDSLRGIDQERVISMNQPLTEGNFTFYQSSFDEAGHGRETSTFSVAYDPGRTLKYCGSLMICLGIAIMFYMRAYFFKRRPRVALPSSTQSGRAALPEQQSPDNRRRAA